MFISESIWMRMGNMRLALQVQERAESVPERWQAEAERELERQCQSKVGCPVMR